jgi:hypothetical protein
MSEPSTDNPDSREVLWVSPEHPAVALRYERPNEQSPWLVTGLIASSQVAGLGSSWMKRFPWRRLGNPHAVARIIWDDAPTMEHLDEVFDEQGKLRANTTDISRAKYQTWVAPPTDLIFAHRVDGITMQERLEYDQMMINLRKQVPPATEQEIEEAKKDFFYKTVARIYEAAVRATGKPVEAVALAYEAPRTSAANWVREARVRGYLPPTTKGRAT